ncbi:MAG: ABC transporter permease, partial [Myxococcales bacterium]|nr:ABC transporter permease [Myxococcales bacterium]
MIDDRGYATSRARLRGGPREAEPQARRIVVRATRGWRFPDLAEVFHFRELFWVLAARDLKVRYKQTVLGAAWAVVQPLFTMVVFTLISRLGGIPTDGAPPQVFYFCGMLPWLLFANAMTSAGNSLLANQHLVGKVYFPRLVIPVASTMTALVDFWIAFFVLAGMMVVYGVAPGWPILLLPAFVLLAWLAAVGFGIWLCALNVEFRDIRHVTPFLVQLWLFATPVLYSSTSVHGGWKALLLGANPVASIVEGVRYCVLGRPA